MVEGIQHLIDVVWSGFYSQAKTNIRFCYFSLREPPSWIRAKSDTQSSDIKICSKSSKHSELFFLYRKYILSWWLWCMPIDIDKIMNAPYVFFIFQNHTSYYLFSITNDQHVSDRVETTFTFCHRKKKQQQKPCSSFSVSFSFFIFCSQFITTSLNPLPTPLPSPYGWTLIILCLTQHFGYSHDDVPLQELSWSNTFIVRWSFSIFVRQSVWLSGGQHLERLELRYTRIVLCPVPPWHRSGRYANC